MGVDKFYLGAHKSGKKEKYPYSNPLRHTVSIVSTFVEYSHEVARGTLDQEISVRATTQNRNKIDYALTLEKYMYDTTK